MEELDRTERSALRRKSMAATLEALHALGGEATRAEIRERALADGDFTERELAAPAPEAAAATRPRLVDHLLSWALTDLKRDGLVDNPKWSTWRLAPADQRRAEPAGAAPDAQRREELWRMPYREYLKTPEWRRTRAATLERAGHRCSMDINHTKGLQVHHRTYDRRGAELPTDLVVVCEACHDLFHLAYGRPGPRWAAATPAPGEPSPGRGLLRRLLAR